MLWPLIYCMVLFLLTYMLTTLNAKYFSRWNATDPVYTLRHDPFIYIFSLMLLGTFLIYFVTPDYSDSISPLRFSQLVISALSSSFLYFFLLYFFKDNRPILTSALIFLGTLVCASCINFENSPLNGYLPAPVQIICVALFISCVALSSKLLIGLPSIFSLFISSSLLGIILLSFLGGLPILYALFAAFFLGIWVAVYQSDKFERNIQLNAQSLSITTLFICTLFAHAISEFSGPSVMILTFYPLSELICALFVTYILRKKENELYLNASYFHGYQRGLSLSVLQSLVFKIGVLNIILSAFQLHSVNAFTLPIIAFVLNLWLISKLYYTDTQMPSFKQASQQVYQNIKQDLKTIKRNIKKD